MEYNVKLLKENDKDILRFYFDKQYDIDLNSEDQSSIKELFYEIIKLSFENEIILKFNGDEHEQDLFYDVAVDYVEKLNNEIKQIRNDIPADIK